MYCTVWICMNLGVTEKGIRRIYGEFFGEWLVLFCCKPRRTGKEVQKQQERQEQAADKAKTKGYSTAICSRNCACRQDALGAKQAWSDFQDPRSLAVFVTWCTCSSDWSLFLRRTAETSWAVDGWEGKQIKFDSEHHADARLGVEASWGANSASSESIWWQGERIASKWKTSTVLDRRHKNWFWWPSPSNLRAKQRKKARCSQAQKISH